MKIIDKICYTQLLWALAQPKFTQSISKVTFTKPDIVNEGMVGYIETAIEIEVSNLADFAEIWHSWYRVEDDIKNHYRTLVLNGVVWARTED